MSLSTRIRRALHAFRAYEPVSEEEIAAGLGTAATRVGINMTPSTAMTIPALFAALNIYAQTFASLPKVIRRRLRNGGSELAREHPLYERLHTKPNNTGMSAWDMVYAQVLHKFLWGNWYTYIQGAKWSDRELIPLSPVDTQLDPISKTVYHTVIDGKPVRDIPAWKMLHIPHITMDGQTGRGVVHYARESLGLSLALDHFAQYYFARATHTGGIVEVTGQMAPGDRERTQADFNQKYSGLGRAWNTIFLTNAKFTKVDTEPEKTQLLQSRQFSVTEACRWTNLPPHILRDLTRATFANIEQQSTELVVYSFMPQAAQIENAMNIAFFDEEERKELFVKFELKGLLRGDLAARTAFYKDMLDRGVFNSDDVLNLEDMNPQPDNLGRIYLVPLNMVDKRALGDDSLELPAPRRRGAERAVPALERRSADLRRKVTKSFERSFGRYASQVIGEEVASLRRIAQDSKADELQDAIAAFYRDFRATIGRAAAPLVVSYASAVLPLALDEVGSSADVSADYEAFGREYVDYLAARHVSTSRQAIADLGQATDGLRAALEELLGKWEKDRAASVVLHESVRAESAFARETFRLIGVKKVSSVMHGNRCPYCKALAGKVIDIEGAFLEAGVFQPEGALEPLTVPAARKHPPYHTDCDCGIAAAG